MNHVEEIYKQLEVLDRVEQDLLSCQKALSAVGLKKLEIDTMARRASVISARKRIAEIASDWVQEDVRRAEGSSKALLETLLAKDKPPAPTSGEPTARQLGNRRLLDVVKALREAPDPARFTMHRVSWGFSEIPACALAHYAARRDLQSAFTLKGNVYDTDGHTIRLASTDCEPMPWFDLTREEVIELFSEKGCGGAESIESAALYIQRFVLGRSFT